MCLGVQVCVYVCLGVQVCEGLELGRSSGFSLIFKNLLELVHSKPMYEFLLSFIHFLNIFLLSLLKSLVS